MKTLAIFVGVLALVSSVVIISTFLKMLPTSTPVSVSGRDVLNTAVLLEDLNIQPRPKGKNHSHNSSIIIYASSSKTTVPITSQGIYASVTRRMDSTSHAAPQPAIETASRHEVTPSTAVTLDRALSVQCSEDNCLNVLSPKEKILVRYCHEDTVKMFGSSNIHKSRCRFLPDQLRKAVALASPEGSGNTWLRGLLEQATGVCTGFCCCDRNMRMQGFIGEGIVSGKVLVVKTHLAPAQWIGTVNNISWEGTYGSAVFLIRNPAMALIAEWNRRVTNRLIKEKKMNKTAEPHTYAVSEDHFGTDKRWKEFSKTYLDTWERRLNNWVLANDRHPVHVVNYEDLQRNTVVEVAKILDFLQFPYRNDTLAERLRDDYTEFKRRRHTNSDFQHFSPEQKEKLRSTLSSVLATAKAAGKADLFLFDEYLESLPNII